MKKISSSILVLVISLITMVSCDSGKKSEKSKIELLPELSVGIQVSPAMGLVMVAKDKGFFEKNGLNVNIVEFTAGKFALQAFLSNSIDIAISGEVPVTLSSLQGHKFKVIAQVVERTINETRMVVQKEGDLLAPEEYFKTKRKIATSFGGGPEFYTYKFFEYYNIDLKNVELISQKPQDMPAALSNGSVDGISIFDPFAQIAELNLGDKVHSFKNEKIYSELYVVNVKKELLTKKRSELLKFLNALYEASIFIERNEEESKKIVVKYTKLSKEVVDGIWNNFIFRPALNNLLVEYTAQQVQWAIDNGKVNKESYTIPNFQDIIYPNLLEEVNKNLVNIK